MLTRPGRLLHLEGAAILALAVYLYHLHHFSWWMFALLFLAPDLSMLGYLKNAKWGAASYNLVHSLTVPVLLLFVALWLPGASYVPYALIWISHIGLDRMLGFGLKYPTVFKDTHLQHV